MNVTPAELYQIIGELFVARAQTDALYKQMLVQAGEMSVVINDLRAENEKLKEALNGQLVKSDRND